MRKTRITYKYLKFFFTAKNTRGHGVHSPYVFNFIESLYNKNPYYVFSEIENLRKELKKNGQILDVVDFGTDNTRKQSIKSIANRSLKPAKYGQMLFRIAALSKSKTILELGTSLGITTAYLASPSQDNKCITMEGCPDIAKVAKTNFEQLGLENINIIVGNIDDELDKTLDNLDTIDFVFIDANHRYEAVISYFEKILKKLSGDAIVVVDDIYWSDGMEMAWNEIKNHPAVTSTIDFFQLGILFFNNNIHNKHYKVRY